MLGAHVRCRALRSPFQNRCSSTLTATMSVPPLVVLDLNGTLLYRKKNNQGRTIPNGKITTRPYLQCFLEYCLGPYYQEKHKKLSKIWPVKNRTSVDKNAAPHGSQFWLDAPGDAVWCPPRTRVCLMIWSSASEENVNKMTGLVAPFQIGRALFQRVWARPTLVTSSQLATKVSTVKDLSIVWDELNRWDSYMQDSEARSRRPRFRSRALAGTRLFYYEKKQEKSKAWKHVHTNHHDMPHNMLYKEAMQRNLSGMLDSYYGPLLHEPFGPKNTILLDDSVGKARCQPNNHICIPEFDAQSASTYTSYLERGSPPEMVDGLDDFLLQFIGVLDVLSDVENVEQWILDGNAATFSRYQTPEERAEWVQRGIQALAARSICVEP